MSTASTSAFSRSHKLGNFSDMDSANRENLSLTWMNTKSYLRYLDHCHHFLAYFFATSTQIERHNETEQTFSCIDCHSFPLDATG